ncbi:translation initiation factor IF-2-like isoform X1 [Gallus gallus]|uniref:translation initiation factor IF-2-like isoform X1 n=1 Tax=Gallus gallus TaxID=9031 RepID=UPI001F0061FA|nr:translation initiation factor IF-2-like isoform X1 [Gallus gallus]
MAAPAAAAARSRSLRIGSRRARPAAAAPPAPRLCPPARRAPAPARCSPPASGWRRRLALRCRCRDCCRPGTALLSHPRDRAAPRPRPRPPGGAPGPAAPTAAKAPRGAPRSAAERAPRGPRGRSRSGRPLGASPRPAAPLWRRFAYPPRLQVGDLGAFDRLFIPPALPGILEDLPAEGRSQHCTTCCSITSWKAVAEQISQGIRSGGRKKCCCPQVNLSPPFGYVEDTQGRRSLFKR